MKKEFGGMTFSLADFIQEKFLESRPLDMYSIGGVGFERKAGKTIHVFPVSDGKNIYKVTVEAL